MNNNEFEIKSDVYFMNGRDADSDACWNSIQNILTTIGELILKTEKSVQRIEIVTGDNRKYELTIDLDSFHCNILLECSILGSRADDGTIS